MNRKSAAKKRGYHVGEFVCERCGNPINSKVTSCPYCRFRKDGKKKVI